MLLKASANGWGITELGKRFIVLQYWNEGQVIRRFGHHQVRILAL